MAVVDFDANVAIVHPVGVAPTGALMDWARIVGRCEKDVASVSVADAGPDLPIVSDAHTKQHQGVINRVPRGRYLHLVDDDVRSSSEYQFNGQHFGMAKLVRRAVQPGIPPQCTAAWQADRPDGMAADDDDTTSEILVWGLSIHCSHAGLKAVPQHLPAEAEYLYSAVV